MSTTAQAIKETIAELTKNQAAKKHYDVLQSSIKSMQDDLATKTLQLSKEQDDIEKLEKMSIAALFHKVLGDKEKQLEKERQEYLALAMKIKELKTSIELSQFEANVLQQKANNVEVLQSKLEDLKNIRKREILTYGEASKGTLTNLMNEINTLSRHKEEINQALGAGEQAKASAAKVLEHLQDALKYGDMDIMGHDMMQHQKHNALDYATHEAYRTQQYLQIYNRELFDIGISDNHLHLNIQTFSMMTDVFFDNLISDWIIQNKIKNTFTHVDSVQDKILLIQQTLVKNYDAAQNRIVELEASIDQLLTKQ